MSITLVLTIFAARCAAFCVPLLRESEMERASEYPARIWRWNRFLQDFELLEALQDDGAAICNVDHLEDLGGVTIDISGKSMSPYLIVNVDGTMTGFIGDVWTILEQALKFRTVYKKPRLPGTRILTKGEIETWLTATSITAYPTGHYSVSHQLCRTYYSLFILSEESRISKWWYTSIFSRGLMAVSFGFVVGITGLLLVMYRLKRAACRNYVECNDELAGPSFNFINVLGVIIGQGFQKFPTSWSLRVLIMSAVIMGMLISCGFNSTLTSYLATRDNTLPFNSLEDILLRRSHSLCVRNDSAAYASLFSFFRSYTSVNSTDLDELVNKDCPDMNSPRDIGTNICKSGFVYLEVHHTFLSIFRRARRSCDIATIPAGYWSFDIVFLQARSATHRRVINKYLLRLRSAGILQYLERKWIPRESPNPINRQWGFRPVEYAHIDLLSVGLLTMMLVSALICVLENIWFRVGLRIQRENRVRRLNNFPKDLYDFPANKLDPVSGRVWAINA